jgi:XTP/dITP diphosphohydrolase
MQIVLASHNAHKLEELNRIIGPHLPNIELMSYIGPEPAETGTTFAENAFIKARAAAQHTGLPAIADDSGIAVDILGGSPGIFSARWAGPGKNDRDNLELLLWQLSDISVEHRGAEFVCAAALALPSGDEDVRVGHWRGSILAAPSGANGFGYDPIFQPEGLTVSAAELTQAEKDAQSHRALAFTALLPLLQQLSATDQ